MYLHRLSPRSISFSCLVFDRSGYKRKWHCHGSNFYTKVKSPKRSRVRFSGDLVEGFGGSGKPVLLHSRAQFRSGRDWAVARFIHRASCWSFEGVDWCEGVIAIHIIDVHKCMPSSSTRGHGVHTTTKLKREVQKNSKNVHRGGDERVQGPLAGCRNKPTTISMGKG